MIKRTLYFGNPAYLKTANEQMLIELPEEKGVRLIAETRQTPIEDLGIVILDHQQITVTQALMAKLLENNVAIITCNRTRHPTGLMLNLDGHSLQSQKFKSQIDASVPLKKQLWQQTVAAKISNQAALLGIERQDAKLLERYSRSVRSGDSENLEAKAAAYYWKHLFPLHLNFTRHREGDPPNNLLNYGYAILRALVARSLVGSGLLPTLGIFHRNQYNSYCLADDIMEPYRPFVDRIVCEIVSMNGKFLEMTPNMKRTLLEIPGRDVRIDEEMSPLMTAVQRTTASLARCFEGKGKRILYPVLD